MTIEFFLTLTAAAVLAAIALVAALELRGLGPRSVVWKFWCSAQNRSVVARFRTSPFSPGYRDVESCSAFPGASITCGKQCLGPHKARA